VKLIFLLILIASVVLSLGIMFDVLSHFEEYGATATEKMLAIATIFLYGIVFHFLIGLITR
jgi:hypothetical protein